MDDLRKILRRYWGYKDFRPLQHEAMQAVLERRDSVVVLPTGGGKSLCFQAPALLMPGVAVVVSPLISLMKDQVDALVNCGVPAAYLNSSVAGDQQRRIREEVRQGGLKLLYLSPERLMTESMLTFLTGVNLSFFAIDEAHCISDWGHDFRPEFRGLRALKETFPSTAIHAYTATATERVRDDISRQLQFKDPAVLVGSFDRPNLTYRILRRDDLVSQIYEVINRHPRASGIIYCLRRRDVDEISATLQADGHAALPYHAGLPDDERRQNQERFAKDEAAIIVATVAFGMGIDKPDVRYVIHAAAPKSLEHYQQESGRAGRDGDPAECCMFFSPSDFVTWRKLQGAEGGPHAAALLADIERFCATTSCRHRAIVNYFGQELASDGCGACDACLGEVELMADPLIVTQKILSCVVRLKEGFGAAYVIRVLIGSRDKRILEQHHDQLSTYGILSEANRTQVRVWIDQLLAQDFLCKSGEFGVLKLTPRGWEAIRGQIAPQLGQPASRTERRASSPAELTDEVDVRLFEELRAWRRQTAAARGVASFVVFSDATLRALTCRRPSTLASLQTVSGIGEKKCAEFGGELLPLIAAFCRRENLAQDVSPAPAAAPRPKATTAAAPHVTKSRAWRLFAEGKRIDEVASLLARAPSTTAGYLCEYLEREGVVDPTPWVAGPIVEQIQQVAASQGLDRLKPLFEAFNGSIPYDQIRIVLICMRNAEKSVAASPAR